MAASIPASNLVRVVPGVIGTGGSALDLVGLFLTNSTRVPVGTVARFASATDVANYFGATAPEATVAATYFAGYDGSTVKPAALLFSQYPAAPVSAYLRGAPLGLTLTQLQALTGSLTVTVDGTARTAGAVNLATATSFSNAATIIAAAFPGTYLTVAWDAQAGAFVITSATTGTTSTMGFATGTLADPLNLGQADGAILSQGAVASTPGPAMDAVLTQTQNFVSFSTVFEPAIADKVSFAAWTDGKGNRFLYVNGSSNAAATVAGDTTSATAQIIAAGYSGTASVYDPNSPARICAMLMGTLASIDFTRTNGRVTAAYRSSTGVPAGVANETIANNLKANGYNFYGAYAAANQGYTFLQPGSVSGPFAWIDSYVNQVWMNAGFQTALLGLLANTGSIPYNVDGYAKVEAALLDQITAAVTFGAIRSGVTLSATQAAQVDAAAGRTISTTLSQRGWYALCLPASPTTRAARQTPPVLFYYTDGQSIQTITLSSVLVA